MKSGDYSAITPPILKYAELIKKNSNIKPEDYKRHNVQRGLRDINGKGVVAGLTEISKIRAFDETEGGSVPCEGALYYRGYDIEDLVNNALAEKRFGFEETLYLLMFGRLPAENDLTAFTELLARYRSLPKNFVRDVILKAPSKDMMNALAKCVLTLASYDEKADDVSVANVIRQCLQLAAVFPLLAVYGYLAYRYSEGDSLVIHKPDPALSTAENILLLLRADSKYTFWEAHILDVCLMLHAEHGGGNNSAFTTHVVTSSGTDTYSCMAAALASLKGPRHGGANIKAAGMIDDMKNNLSDWSDEDAIRNYLLSLLRGEAFDRTGLIYGMGHAVYSLSDPRANILRSFVSTLSGEKGRTEEFELYKRVERIAPEVIAGERRIYKGVSANVDFYSGFVYQMLDLPPELYTPIFAVARVGGWSAHRLEELINVGKIIRPEYTYVGGYYDYEPLGERRIGAE